MELLLVTGLSGAGKSKVVDALEDLGYFCADNMPPNLINTFAQIVMKSSEDREKTAFVTDIRSGKSYETLFDALSTLKSIGCSYKILFVDASDDVLIRRYSETRRKHPLLDKCDGSIIKSIETERKMLSRALSEADYVIDTSGLTIGECKKKVAEILSFQPGDTMRINCMSFGYKYGIPNDADLIFDVRCMPNPFYEAGLKEKTGLDKPVRDFVMKFDQSKELEQKLEDLLDFLIPYYTEEGKSQLTIAMGCTGGRHRSVCFAELMREHLSNKPYAISIFHRDITK